ncbi:T9SS type B sorting domain-containing protein [Flavobacterium psychraquaticum]|uniref:T9SS type B sorting domain-containing protein n=1 Tax=Flavobacterium psychraquaticum TaxID=3103958 RepID=UPI002ACD512C|nr:T9SS type B sorting domain-containing protein [Flavobacterium sp. LB-N7T]
MPNRILLFTLCIFSSFAFSQLSNKHWLPPLHSRSSADIEDQYIYLSTAETTPFNVTVTDGSGQIIAGSPFSLSATTPVVIYIGDGENTKMFLNINDVNTKLSDKGLILEGNKDFYASFRMRSRNHSETLISKGRPGIGTSFRLGCMLNETQDYRKSFVASVMATENNTVFTLSDYNPDVVFVSGSGDFSTPNQTFSLDKGESVIFSGYSDNPTNIDGIIGALITSNKPVAVNSGNALGGIDNNRADFALDQIVSASQIGTEYIFIEGNGLSSMELPLIVANENGTEIFINGSTVPIITLNAGGYFLLDNANYQGSINRNMYVKTNKPVFAYQLLGGGNDTATAGLNFIPPLSCFFQNSVNIPAVNRIGATTYIADLMVLTYTSATLTVNGNAIPTTQAQTVLGNTDWVTYRVSNISGNANITSTGPLAVGVFGYGQGSGTGIASGYAGYYSGFGSTPQDTDIIVCTNTSLNLFDNINGNPEPGGTWTVPAGGAPLNGNTFDPSINLVGEYEYSFTKDCNSSPTPIKVKVTVSTQQVGNPGTSNTTNICINSAPIDLFTLLGSNAEVGGTWSPALASGSGLFNPAVDIAGVYTYTIPEIDVCQSIAASITVIVNPEPTIINISDFKLCDDNSDGDDTNGIVTFNLTTKTIEILNGQTGINVTYHTSPTDATNGVGSITSITTSDRTIYVRLQNNITNCFATTSFELKVLALPVVNTSITLKQCDTDTDAITDFNLTEANSIISSETTNTYTYHTTQVGAQNNTSIITNELSYTAPNGSQVWARIVNTEGCSRTALVNLVVSTTTIPSNYKFTIEACDDYLSISDPANDGFAYFNLDNPVVVQNAVQNLLSFFSATQPLIVTFYENESDALAELNAIIDITNYRNTTPNSQIIWARIDSDLNNECFGVGPFIQLTVNPLPTVSLGPDFVICVDPITGLGSQVVDATPTATGNYSYEWTPTNPAGNVPTFEITTGGTFSVIVTNLTTNCSVAESITTTFSSEPATFEANLITPAFAAGLSTIEAIATGGFGTYEYSVNTIDWQSSPLFTNLENGSYIVYVRDIQGCGILFSEEIQTITYPNYFTPNGDGYNDYWNITLPITYEGKIKIYDRYGKFLKQLSSEEQGWDGTYRGNMLPSTDYWFIVEYIENDQQKEFKSHFSLKR